MIFDVDGTTVDVVSNLIQLAVAPVFLIAGVGAILGVLSNRLARITDRIERLNNKINQVRGDPHLPSSSAVYSETELNGFKIKRKYLQIRANNMNLAILFCILTGLLVAAVIMTLFLSSFFEFRAGFFIAIMFITGMGSFMLSLLLFIREVFMATYFMQRTQEKIGVE